MSNQTLDEILAVFANYDDSDEYGYEEGVLSRIENTKAAIKQLVADEMREADEMRAILRGLSEELQEMKKLGRKYMRISDLEYSINKSIVLHERAKLKEVK